MIDVSELDEGALEDILSEPTDATKDIVAGLNGDIVVLGAGGKMGPTLAMMLRKASSGKNIYAVSRFSDKAVRTKIERAGIKTIQADLLDESLYSQLPDVENVFYLAGMKFGSTGNQPLTWVLNSFLPGLVARHYKDSRIVVFSTGNVYPLVDINGGGASEKTAPDPIGEYAQSCLGRERIIEYFSQLQNTPMTIVRLNYANEPRYGIIVDLTQKILNDVPVDLTMGAVNLIWQRDALQFIIRSISLAKSPPTILNVTGPDTVLVRQLAEKIGQELNKKPKFTSREARTILLSNASFCFSTFGYPQTALDEMVSLIVKWVASGKTVLNKPTKYDIRNGKF
ncbi:MAG TPA: NAD-dependent epimerase/dehydratase family protein [Sedimentisphaerales bacterium]|nr:NAD-dependent epimerase/dehydratase family protein [Sedimentisphaerales bacterium]